MIRLDIVKNGRKMCETVIWQKKNNRYHGMERLFLEKFKNDIKK